MNVETSAPAIPVKGPRPIPVKVLKFIDGAQYLPGGEMKSSITAAAQENARTTSIEYHPWARSFLVSIRRDTSKPPASGYIPEHRVQYWEPAE